MIRWTGLAPWEFEFPFPGSLTSTFIVCAATYIASPLVKITDTSIILSRVPASEIRSTRQDVERTRSCVSLGTVGSVLGITGLLFGGK